MAMTTKRMMLIAAAFAVLIAVAWAGLTFAADVGYAVALPRFMSG